MMMIEKYLLLFFQVLYADVKTAMSVSPPSFSYGKFTSHQQQQPANNPITSISVRYQNYESVHFHDCEEEKVLKNFANYIADKDPDVIFCRNDSNLSSVLQNICTRARKLGLETMRFGRDSDISGGDFINLSAGRIVPR